MAKFFKYLILIQLVSAGLTMLAIVPYKITENFIYIAIPALTGITTALLTITILLVDNWNEI